MNINKTTYRMERRKINGYPIIAWLPLDNEAQIILVDKGPKAYERYVVAVHYEASDNWYLGNYFTNPIDAFNRFIFRSGFPLIAFKPEIFPITESGENHELSTVS